ncbi:hypothetical protein BH09SUM1_BH09SUM1_31220 [soil metagenome]
MSERVPPAEDVVTILVAEDSPTQAEQIRWSLEEFGYKVLIAPNGKRALELAAEHHPTLIITDIIMPEMDGFTLCQEVKKNPKLHEIPVMLLTSLSDTVDVVRGLECGADNFLVKPCEDRYLKSRIDYILANRLVRSHDAFQMGLQINFAGNKYTISSDRLQILNLLLSTYETAVEKNRDLTNVQAELKALAESLEVKVQERTALLQAEVEERRRAEESLQRGIERERKLSEQLQQAQKMEAIGRLAGGVAHDFNNLLSVIIGCSELLWSRAPDDKFFHELLEDITAAGRRAAGLTGQLLAFSRKSIISPEVILINDLIRQLSKMLTRLIGEDIDVAIKLDKNAGMIMADPSQIEQVIMNLAVNSRDAMPQGGKLIIETHDAQVDEPFVQSHVGLQVGHYMLLTVSDNGSGMTEDTKAHIFEPFFTTKGIGKGTGLGLATIYGIVTQCHGHIFVYSELGSGTTFRVYIPVVEESSHAIRKMQYSPEESPKGKETILLVEDEDAVRRLSRHVLEIHGYNVIEARNGKHALEVAAAYEGDIDLLLADVIMPELGGPDLADQLCRKRPLMSVLYMSGYTDDAVTRFGLLQDQMPLLQKPFTPGVLARRLREILDKRP